MEFATKCLRAGYQPKNGEPGALPIVQSTTYKYDTTEQVAKLFDLQAAGFFYSRLANPTVDSVEQKDRRFRRRCWCNLYIIRTGRRVPVHYEHRAVR